MNTGESKTEVGATGATVSKPRRSWVWRGLRFCLLGGATLVTLFVLFHLEENWRGKRAWTNYKARMEAQGAVFTLRELAPPEVPDEENFAMTPLLKPLLDLLPADTEGMRSWEDRYRDPAGVERAKAIMVNDLELDQTLKYDLPPQEEDGNEILLPKTPSWRMGERFQLDEWQAYYALSEVFPSWPESRGAAEDVLKALSRYDAELEELREASRRPHVRFNLEYDSENPIAMLLPHLGVLRSVAKVVQLRAVAELDAGDVEAAYQDTMLLIAMGDAVKSDPFLLSHLIGVALFQMANQVIWEGLIDQRWTDSQLEELQRRLSETDLLGALQGSLVAERAGCTQTLLHLADRPSQQEALLGDMVGSVGSAIWLVPKGWIYFNTVNYNRVFDEHYLPCLPSDGDALDVGRVKTAFRTAESELEAVGVLGAVFQHKLVVRLLIPALEKVAERSAQGQAMNDMAVVAMGLERYRQVRGGYPSSLESLSPGFLPAPVNDPVTHEAFRYERLNSGGYRLWSVGWDEADQGGVVVYEERSGERHYVSDQPDWVWPATEGMKLEIREDR